MGREPLRIGIDARLVTYRRGIGNYVYNLIAALARRDDPYTYELYTDSDRASEFLPQHPRFTVRVLRPRVYPCWEQVALPVRAAQDRVDVLHCPANAGPLALLRRVHLVLTIHDVMYMLPPQAVPRPASLYQRLGRSYLRHVVPFVARRSTAVATISHFSANDIARVLTLDRASISVVYEAGGPEFRRMEPRASESLVGKLGVRAPFVVALGALDPRKNTSRLIDAFTIFAMGAGIDHQLVVVGLAPAAQAHFARLAVANGMDNRVVLLGYVAEAELVALYNSASMMVYPSLYEGFGVPVLEAMACGVPVIASDRASVPEIAGDSAILVDPTNVNAIAVAMTHIASDVRRRHRLVESGYRRALEFSWDRTAAETTALYERASTG